MDKSEQVLNIAFESGQLSYTGLEVDLYNTGLNQILSMAAARGHLLYHFSMEDLYLHEDRPHAKASILDLPENWYSDPLECYRLLKKIDERPVDLSTIDLCFFRADDVRNCDTPNLDLIRAIEEQGILMENVEATLSTNDKYEIIVRCPGLPRPSTYAACTLEEAMEALKKLPRNKGSFVLKDRYGYGCGHAVHRIDFADPELTEVINMYLNMYNHILLQEFCSEVEEGDIVVTFFDGEIIGSMLREAAPGEWKTNFSLGAAQLPHSLSPEQEEIARSAQKAFPECRLLSVDMLQSGKVLEVNAFPGGQGLLELYGISLSNMVLDRLESELLGKPKAPSAMVKTITSQPAYQWEDIYAHYEGHAEKVEVVDVFSEEKYILSTKDLIEFRPQNPDFILSIPHSGVLIPAKYQDHFKLDAKSLLEIDLFSDILFEALGGLQVISRLTPFFVDMNRRKNGSKSKRLPRHLGNPPTEYYNVQDELILQKGYTPYQEESILEYYDLYHEILASVIEKSKKERGYALLIDAHSMTSVGLGRVHDEGEERDNIVVGTLDDTSAHPEIISAFINTLKQGIKPYGLGLTYAKNEPYSGGFITRMHSDRDNDVHVIQVEVTMDTYMYEAIETDKEKRYALKQSRLRIAQDFLRKAALAASDTARRLYV